MNKPSRYTRREVSKLGNNKGTTIVELLVSLAIMSIVIVSILTGFSQQQVSERVNNYKSAALMLAELRMDEFMKYSSSQMSTPTTITDYILLKKGAFQEFASDEEPNQLNQFRRVVTITPSDSGGMTTIGVVVEYGAMKNKGDSSWKYPFQVEFSCIKGEIK